MQKIQNSMQKYVEKGWIQPTRSQYNHPILFIHEKTCELRVCIDYKSLKINTIIDRYLTPRIDDTLGRLEQAKILRKTDLASGYHQVEMHPDYHQD